MGSTGMCGRKGMVGAGQWGLQLPESVPMGSQKSVESWWCLQI